MQNMRNRVMPLNRIATIFINREYQARSNCRDVGCIYDLRFTICDVFGSSVVANEMQPDITGFLGISDAPELAAASQLASIADLSTHLGVANATVEDNSGLVLE